MLYEHYEKFFKIIAALEIKYVAEPGAIDVSIVSAISHLDTHMPVELLKMQYQVGNEASPAIFILHPRAAWSPVMTAVFYEY